MFREALTYPVGRPEGPRSVLLGGGLVFLTSLFGLAAVLGGTVGLVAVLGLVPWIALRGYYVRVVRTTVGRDRPTPPPFDGPRRLVRDGLASLAVTALYLLPGVVVIGPLGYARAVGTDAGTVYAELGLPVPVADAALSATGVLAMLAAMYLLGAFYAIPVAVARFAVEERLRAAFEVRHVLAGALSEDYAVAWAVSLLVQALLFPVAYLLRAVIAGFFLHVVVAVGVRYCYGQGVGDGLDLAPAVPARSMAGRTADTPGDARSQRTRDPGEDPLSEERRHRPGTAGVEGGGSAGGEGERT